MNDPLVPIPPESLQKFEWLRLNWRRHPIAILVVAVFFVALVGWQYKEHLFPARGRAFIIRLNVAKPVPLFDHTVVFSLNTTDPSKDTLEFGSLATWSNTASGPFQASADGHGPAYRAGSQYFLRLPNGELWIINVLEVLNDELVLQLVPRT